MCKVSCASLSQIHGNLKTPSRSQGPAAATPATDCLCYSLKDLQRMCVQKMNGDREYFRLFQYRCLYHRTQFEKSRHSTPCCEKRTLTLLQILSRRLSVYVPNPSLLCQPHGPSLIEHPSHPNVCPLSSGVFGTPSKNKVNSQPTFTQCCRIKDLLSLM